MRIDRPQLERAMSELGFTREQTALLWSKLDSTPDVQSRFEPAHVGYFFGALLVIGAMGWFITDGWDRFAGWQLTAIALVYASLLAVTGSRFWRKSMYRIPGGLLITSISAPAASEVFFSTRHLPFREQNAAPKAELLARLKPLAFGLLCVHGGTSRL